MELTKKQLAFVNAMKSVGGIPKKATINFITNNFTIIQKHIYWKSLFVCLLELV